MNPLRRLLRDRLGDEAGFTIAELGVVMAIVGILFASVVPTLTGSQRQTQDRDAQASLRYVLTNGLSASLDASNPSTLPLATIASGLNGLTVVAYETPSTGAREVSAIAGQCYAYGYSCGGGGFWVAAAVKSKSGTCWAAYIPAYSNGGAARWMWRATTSGICSSFQALSGGAGWTTPWAELSQAKP